MHPDFILGGAVKTMPGIREAKPLNRDFGTKYRIIYKL
jgi:hypothetical protein